MAALIVGIAVMAVLMTAAMPVWKQTVQREKEEEMVFRGEQIAHAIGLFQRKTANSYPPSVDILVQQKFLRKKYKDPITNDDFVPLTQAAQAAQRGAQPAPQGQQGRGGPATAATPGAPTQGGVPVGGIIGVTSKSTDQSIRLYKGRAHYNEWAFIFTPPAQAPGTGAAGAQGANGGRGQGPQRGQQPPPGGGGGFGGRGGPFQPGQNGPGGRANLPPGFPQGPGRGR